MNDYYTPDGQNGQTPPPPPQQQAYYNAPNGQYPPPGYYPQQPYEQKSKMAAGLLGIFLGYLGIHNFYLGYTSKAVAQLLLGTVGGFFCGIGTVAAAIWGFVEGIMILTGSISVDGHGVPLKE